MMACHNIVEDGLLWTREMPQGLLFPQLYRARTLTRPLWGWPYGKASE